MRGYSDAGVRGLFVAKPGESLTHRSAVPPLSRKRARAVVNY